VRAAVYRGAGDLRIEEVPEPQPADDELLVQVAAAGICGTDGHEYAYGPVQFAVPSRSGWGPPDALIPGHEFSGTVISAGRDVAGFRTGDLVASGSGIACGKCSWCHRGRTNLCLSYETVGLQRHGGLAQFCVVPARCCAVVDQDRLSPDTAALAQPMAIAVHAASVGQPAPGMDVLVIGAGGIGAFLTFVLAQSGARVTIIEPAESRRALARSLGAAVALPPPASKEMHALLHEEVQAEIVYEVTGSAGGLNLALAAIGRGARVVVVGMQGKPASLDFRHLSISESQLAGTNAMVAATDLPRALDLLADRSGSWADVAPVALALDDLVDAGIRPLATGQSERVKTLVDPWASATRSTQF
jgi:(R,R)-butanediol dehydrogenase / meso-butanediol dehydrogenase / diacetyl reductase